MNDLVLEKPTTLRKYDYIQCNLRILNSPNFLLPYPMILLTLRIGQTIWTDASKKRVGCWCIQFRLSLYEDFIR